MKNNQAGAPDLFAHFRDDFRSGLVVFLVALPLCLGIALASGAPLFSGILSGIIGGLVVGSLSGSSLSISGPAAGLTVIVLSGIHRVDNHFETFLLAVVIAGILQIILGFLRAGVISLFFPSAVIRGMLAAIGIILILKQIPHALGDDKDAEGEFEFFQLDGENTLTEIANAIGDPQFGAVLISIVSIVALLSWDILGKRIRSLQFIPASLVVVLVGTMLNIIFSVYIPALALQPLHMVSLPVIKGLQDVPNLLVFPDFSQIANPKVYITAITIAIVASLETLLNIEATDKLDPLKRRTPANRELKAQGVGNLVAGLIGGIPVTSVIVRSSTNILSGAKSKLSAIIHGVLLLLSVLFFARFMNYIPLASLAVILIFVGYKLAKWEIFQEMYKLGLSQFLPFVVTVVAVIFTDLLIGIGIGMIVGIFFILRENLKTSYFLTTKINQKNRHIHIDLSEHVSFLNKASIAEILENLPDNSTVEIDGTKSTFIDHDVLEVIKDFQETAKAKNITLGFVNQINRTYNIKLPENHNHEHIHVQNTYQQLLVNNKKWVAEKLNMDPDFFEDMAKGQQPRFFFISCSDSRVHPNEITGTQPGEMFIHRNVANLVVNTDLNFMSVLQYAVEVLKVEHIIVCGHYGCGGVKAALENTYHGLIDKWLLNIKDVYRLHRAELDAITEPDEKFKRMVELNIREQVYNIHKTSVVQKAWSSNARLRVHGWVYDIREGIVKDLQIRPEDIFYEYGHIYKLDFKEEENSGQ
ncbi:SulP family inorganic anion transporter [Cytophagaceae bacterium YF14B1]|uniref:Carbonic anhydrase 2 n=1 Tax=Xanthocytophaga flava TaxID=3048013 RepID=A0AAE3QRD4_9BACT|nr:SulP family inorganic anion transporter [Xanthocytophaga flavus]MDJ1483516.1 SulP family inorganic anion transporter [Xanthocytophaga flavus]